MNSPDCLHRLRTGFLCAAFALAVSDTRAQALPELTIEGAPGDERVKLSWPDSGELLKLDYSGDAGTRATWAPVPDAPVLSGGIFSLQYEVSNKGGFWRLRRPDLVPPVFPQPTGPTTVALGNVTRLRLMAVDAGGPVKYTVEPSPLPEGAHLDDAGVLTFRPVEGMSGDFTFRFIASDIWGNSTSRTVTINVTVAAAGTPTSFTGLVIDLDATAGGGFVPIVNARVALLGTGAAAFTDATGRFNLTGIPAGLQVMDITTANAEPGPGGAKYAYFRENYRLIPNVANVDDRPFYLPRLDESSMTPVVPGLSTGVVNPNLNIAMTVGANTAVTDDGSGFTGELSITRVPEELAPAKLPDELGQTSLITIQPVGVTFTTPAPITFPNTDNLPPGAGTDLWSLDPKSGSWVIVGTGRVTPDGQWIETVSGGIRAAEWHAVMPPQPCPENGGDDPDHHDPNGNCNGIAGSEVSLHTGGLRTGFVLPPWYANGDAQVLQLVYNSRFAFPYVIVNYNAVNSIRAAVPNSISQEISLGGNSLGFPAVAFAAAARNGAMVVRSNWHYDTRRLSENLDEYIRMAFGFDGSSMDTGYYPYRALVTSNYSFSSIGASFNRRTTVINESKSVFGAGWTLSGLQKLHPVRDDPNRYLVVNGDGAHSLFTKGVTDRPFVVGGFSAARSGAQSFPQGSSYSGARAAILAAYPQATFQGMDTITASGLAAVDMAVLSPITGPTTATPLSAAEQSAFFAWVQGGGCALLCIDHDLGRTAFNEADESLIAAFGITSENSSGDIVFVSPENSPITSGIHGDVPRFTRAFGGRKVISPGNWGRSIAIDPQGGIGLVEIPEERISAGSGQVLVVTDTQAFLDGGAGVGNADHRALLLNTIDAFLTTQEPPGADLVFRGPKGEFSRLLKKQDGTLVRRYPDGSEVRFDSAGRMTAGVDRNGNLTAYNYDAQGRLTSLTDPAGLTAAFSYSAGRLTGILDPAGRNTSIEHDAAGNMQRAVLPGGVTHQFQYDDRHLMTRHIRPGGFQVDREFDGAGRLVRTRWSDGTVREIQAVQTAALPVPASGLGSPESPAPVIHRDDVHATLSSPEGVAVAKTNNFGQEVELIAPGGDRTVTERDANGLPVRILLPTGEDYRLTHNRNGQLVRVEDTLFSGVSQMAYASAHAQPLAFTNQANRTWTYTLDARGNRTGLTTPAGRITTATYNAAGLQTAVLPPGGLAEQIFEYDSAGRLNAFTAGTGPEARRTTFARDAAGRITGETNALNQTSLLTWSSAGPLSGYTDAGGRAVQITLDAAGRATGITPPGRARHTFVRDVPGRVIAYQPPAGGDNIHYEYDAWGFSRIASGSRSVRYERNSAGKVTAVRLQRGDYTLAYHGRSIARAESPDGIVEDYTCRGPEVQRVIFSGELAGQIRAIHDPAHRLQQHQVNSHTPIGFSYDADGLITGAGALTLTRSAASGRVTGVTLGVVSETISSTPFGEEAEHSVSASGTPLLSFARTFDKLGRVLTEAETIGGTTTNYAFAYDASGRLTAVTRNGAAWFSYAYDANNNRTAVTGPEGVRSATYDSNDRLLTDGAATFTHNSAGQWTARSGSAPLTLNLDELGAVTGASAAAGNLSWKLDASGRRAVKYVNGVRRQAFLWGSMMQILAELDSANQVLSEFVYAAHVSVPEYLIRDGVNYRLVTDRRGSVRLVVNAATGAIVQRMDYGPFGELLLDTNPGFQPFGFCSGLHDADTGLVHFALRDYDPRTGRFISRDPLLFAGGDTNLYAYAGNDPVNRTDPSGGRPTRDKQKETLDVLTHQVPKVLDTVRKELESSGTSFTLDIWRACVGVSEDRAKYLADFLPKDWTIKSVSIVPLGAGNDPYAQWSPHTHNVIEVPLPNGNTARYFVDNYLGPVDISPAGASGLPSGYVETPGNGVYQGRR